MRTHPSSSLLALLVLTALVPARGGTAQESPSPGAVALAPALEAAVLAALPRQVSDAAGQEPSGVAAIVAKEIAVGRDEASLRLELADGSGLEIRFEDDRVHIDGRDVGAHDAPLAGAWRELLGRAVALENGPLARALVAWQPPDDVEGEVAGLVDEALEGALRRPEASAPDAGEGELRALTRLLGRSERLAALAAALDDLDVEELRVRIDEDVVVGGDEEVDGTLLVIDGDVEVHGRVREHVVVVGGTLRTFDGSEIAGDVRLSDARLVRSGGTIAGIVREMESGDLEARIEERVREAERRMREADEETRRAAREVRVRMDRHDDGGLFGPLLSLGRSVGRGITGLVETFVALVVLSLLGGLMIAFGQSNLEVVAETARRSPGRAAVVGIAGAFLTFPVWLLGAVALAISIIGLPVMLAWLPLFPLAVVLAAALGYFAVAHNTGEWLARRRYPYLEWIRSSNPYTLVVGGVLGLLGAFFLANLVSLFGPWLGFLKGMLIAAGVVITTGAALIGFGAVLLTRAGRRPEYWSAGGGDPLEDDWGWDPPPGPSSPKGGPGTGRGPAGTGSGPREAAGTGGTAAASAGASTATGSEGGAPGSASDRAPSGGSPGSSADRSAAEEGEEGDDAKA